MNFAFFCIALLAYFSYDEAAVCTSDSGASVTSLISAAFLSPPSVNEVNIGGDYEIGRSVHCVRVRRYMCPSFRVCVCVSVYMISINSNDVIAPTLAITLTSLPSPKQLFFLPPLFLCLHHFTWRRYALLRVPSC